MLAKGRWPEKSSGYSRVTTNFISVYAYGAGRADVGIKRLFLPCCIKGKFYANLTLLHKGKMLCQPRLAVTKDKLLCQVLWHKTPLCKSCAFADLPAILHKGKILCQVLQLKGSTTIALITVLYPSPLGRDVSIKFYLYVVTSNTSQKRTFNC